MAKAKLKGTPAPPKPPPVAAPKLPRVHSNHQCHTCIELRRVDGVVTYLAFTSAEGVCLYETSVTSFDSEYAVMPAYDAARAAKLYAGFALDLGATDEAMAELGRLTTLTQQEIAMATKRKTQSEATKKAAAPKKAAGKKAPVKKEAAPKKAAAPKAEATPKEKKVSAASRFAELIMAGKHTDDQIFATVQKEFGLSDDKRGYVKWYRNNLKKKGQNPPEAKTSK